MTNIGLLCLVALLLTLERLPRFRRSLAPVRDRWATNIGLLLVGTVSVSIFFRFSLIEVTADLPGGVMHGTGLPLALEACLVFLLLDCLAYWEHRLFHEIPQLWRLHLVHHSDTAIDVTTGQRHHPLEKLLSSVIGIIVVFALGFSAQALAIYLLIAHASAIYTHANVRLPEAIDKSLRRWLITPAVHAIHHSSYQPETDSNYGSVLTLWDRLFGTYTSPATARIPSFGLEYFRQPDDALLVSTLLQPFLPVYAPNDIAAQQPPVVQQDRDNAIELSPAWQKSLYYCAAGLALTVLALWPTVVHLTQLWSETQSYQYAWLVLPIFIYMAGWHCRDSILAMTPRPTFGGLIVLAAATVLWVFAFATDIKLGQHIALVLVLQGIFLGTMGSEIYRRFLPLLLLLFFMVPCGDVMQPLLRDLTVKWIEWFAIITDLPHTIDGYYLMLREHEYIVLDACSGLQFFTMGSFLGYSLGLLLFRSLGKVVAFAALGAALGIATNALRVCLIVAVDQIRGSQLDLAGHTDIQWLVWLASLGLMLYCANRLAKPNGAPA